MLTSLYCHMSKPPQLACDAQRRDDPFCVDGCCEGEVKWKVMELIDGQTLEACQQTAQRISELGLWNVIDVGDGARRVKESDA